MNKNLITFDENYKKIDIDYKSKMHSITKKLRITLLSGEADTPGHVYRVTRLADALRNMCELSIIHLTLTQPNLQPDDVKTILRSDFVWAWRIDLNELMEKTLVLFKKQGGRLILDMDDLVFSPEHMVPRYIDALRFMPEDALQLHKARAERRCRALGYADLFVSPTATLGEIAQHLSGTSYMILQNGFDNAMLEQVILSRKSWNLQKKDKSVRIGYACGSFTHQADFFVASKALALTLKEYPHTRLTVFKDNLRLNEFPEFLGLENQIEWRNYVPLNQLPQEIARFDINIIPLDVSNIFCSCKSDLKFFEAALGQIPTIASPTPPFVQAIVHGQTGLVAHSHTNWMDALTLLVQNESERIRIGANAFASVLGPYGPEARVAQAIAILRAAR